jgi:dipeptidyl aminopeptidase/acylaminoacyl peptidase
MIRAVNARSVVAVLVLLGGVVASAQPAPQLVLSQLTWFTRAGTTLGKVGPLADHGNFELSPDGSKVAVAVMDPSKGTRDIWIYDAAAGTRSRFTTDVAEENWMIWSPNGQRVTLNRFVPGLSRLLESPVSGATPEETLQLGEGGVWPVSWSPDGRAILYVTNSRETGNDIWVLPVGGAKPYPFQQTPASENWAAFSPDGRWVAFSSTASSDIPEVFVTRFPGGGQAWRISADGGSQARWRRDGKEIFYLAPDRRLMAAAVEERDGVWTTTTVEPLFTLTFPYGAYHAFDVSPDGTRFLVNTMVGGNAPTQQVQRPPQPASERGYAAVNPAANAASTLRPRPTRVAVLSASS